MSRTTLLPPPLAALRRAIRSLTVTDAAGWPAFGPDCTLRYVSFLRALSSAVRMDLDAVFCVGLSKSMTCCPLLDWRSLAATGMIAAPPAWSAAGVRERPASAVFSPRFLRLFCAASFRFLMCDPWSVLAALRARPSALAFCCTWGVHFFARSRSNWSCWKSTYLLMVLAAVASFGAWPRRRHELDTSRRNLAVASLSELAMNKSKARRTWLRCSFSRSVT